MLQGVVGLLKSKKAIGTVLGLVVSAVGYIGLEGVAADEFAKHVIALLMAYVGGQSIADAGKEKIRKELGLPEPSFKEAISGLFKSKKMISYATSLVALLLSYVIAKENAAQFADLIVAGTGTLVLGQGVADWQKESAKLKANGAIKIEPIEVKSEPSGAAPDEPV